MVKPKYRMGEKCNVCGAPLKYVFTNEKMVCMSRRCQIEGVSFNIPYVNENPRSDVEARRMVKEIREEFEKRYPSGKVI